MERISIDRCKSAVRSHSHACRSDLKLSHCFNGILVFSKQGKASKLHHFILYNPTTKEKLRIVTNAYLTYLEFILTQSKTIILCSLRLLTVQHKWVPNIMLLTRDWDQKYRHPPTEAQTQTRNCTKLVSVVSGGGPNNSLSYLPKNPKFATPVIADAGVLYWIVQYRYGDGAFLGPCC